jgi:hypothetical protein
VPFDEKLVSFSMHQAFFLELEDKSSAVLDQAIKKLKSQTIINGA